MQLGVPRDSSGVECKESGEETREACWHVVVAADGDVLVALSTKTWLSRRARSQPLYPRSLLDTARLLTNPCGAAYVVTAQAYSGVNAASKVYSSG